jgi:hypothetical protein
MACFSANLTTTLAGVFFSDRARTSAHIESAFVRKPLRGVRNIIARPRYLADSGAPSILSASFSTGCTSRTLTILFTNTSLLYPLTELRQINKPSLNASNIMTWEIPYKTNIHFPQT